jgi:Mg-chelatase subunit ChlD
MSATLTSLGGSILSEWRALEPGALQFWQRDTAQLALVAIVASAVLILLIRSAAARRPGRHDIALPAILRGTPAFRLAWTRHLPAVFFVAGLPFALLAVADPYTSLVAENVTYPGRRIALMIDASDSMQTSFRAATLNTRNEVQPAFFTTVAAAERFVELRRKGKYRDLMALVEFGSRAYVITPFTSDYDNLVLSMALIGDPVEFSLFPDSGTVIASALEESIEIFKAFDFLEASGNLMVIFTDGEDTTRIVHGRSLDDILKSAVDNGIPLFFVRTNYDKEFGEGNIPDAQWRAAVEKTGGRYYVAKDEASLIAAVNDIDREAAGTISARQYTSQQPRFTLFALAAFALWTGAASLKVATPWFSKIP